MTRIATGTPRPAAADDEDRPRGFRGGFRGGISNLRLTKDGRTLYFQEGESVYSTPVGGGGGGGGGLAGMLAALRGGGQRGSGESSSRRRPAAVAAARGGGSASTSPSGSTSPRNGTRCSTTPGAA